MKVIFNLIILVVLSLPVYGQEEYIQTLEKERKEADDYFKNRDTSPLTKKDRRKFKKLNYFTVNPAYRVNAHFHIHDEKDTFLMPTTTERKPVYVRYGELLFELNGETHKLQVYQNVDLAQKEGYEDYLFLPFLDETNGIETYGGGRYLDIRMPAGDTLTIDFNKAYNPYCAYNKKYSCPIVPAENRLEIPIKAGVRKWH